jgi:hypothetical protein
MLLKIAVTSRFPWSTEGDGKAGTEGNREEGEGGE